MARQVMNNKKKKIHSLSFGNNYISDQFSKNKVKQATLWGYIATTCTTQVELTQAKLCTVKSFPIDYTVFIHHMLECKSTT